MTAKTATASKTVQKRKPAPPPGPYRQGDVRLDAITAIPANANVVARDKRGVILADSKATGHLHRITQKAAVLSRTEDGARYLDVVEPVELQHEEHKTECRHASHGENAPIATHVEGNTYTCKPHATKSAHPLRVAGATELAPARYLVTIHTEYQPGELPRQVED